MPPAVPPANAAVSNNPTFDESAEYAIVDYAEVGTAARARALQQQAQAPQYDEVGFVRDQYAKLDSNHSIYSDA